MLKIITTLMLSFTGTLTQTQTERSEMNQFSKIEVSNGIELVYTQSDSFSISTAAADTAQLASLVTENDNGILKIYRSDANAAGTVTVYVSANSTNEFKASTGARIRFTNPVSVANAAIILNSGARFNGTVKGEKIRLEAHRGTEFNIRTESRFLLGNFDENARVNLSGTVENATINTSEKVLCNARNFKAGSISVNAENTAYVMVHVIDDIRIDVAGAATVSYTGNPEKVRLSENALSLNPVKDDKLVAAVYE